METSLDDTVNIAIPEENFKQLTKNTEHDCTPMRFVS